MRGAGVLMQLWILARGSEQLRVVRASLRWDGATMWHFYWLMQIPLAWVLALPLGWAHSGVFWGAFVSQTAVGVLTLWLFSRGRWKTTKV